MNGKKDDGMNMNQCGMCGGSGMMNKNCCGYHGGMMHCGFGWKIVRVIIGLVVLGIVFSFGVLVGQLRAIVGGGVFHRGSMMGSYYGQGYYPMMGNWNPGVPATSTPIQ